MRTHESVHLFDKTLLQILLSPANPEGNERGGGGGSARALNLAHMSEAEIVRGGEGLPCSIS